MNYHDLMKMDENIFLRKIEEDVSVAEMVLKIQIDRAKTSNKSVPAITVDDVVIEANPIEVDESLPILELEFPFYIGYSVLNEGVTPYQEDEVYEGGSFRIYSKSKYLDFVRSRTFAEGMYSDLVHYQIPCLNHIIDVITNEPPLIREISRD